MNGIVGGKILRGDMEQVAQFSVYVRGDCDYVLSIASGAYPLWSSALPGHKTVIRLATIATEYVVVKQGMYVEWGKHAYTERGQKCTRAYI